MKMSKTKIISCSVGLLLVVALLWWGYRYWSASRRYYLDDNLYGQGEMIATTPAQIEALNQTNSTYVLFTYNNYCTMPIACETIFADFAARYQLSLYTLPYEDFKDTSLHQVVAYAPSVLIVHNGKIVAYLDAESDQDYSAYQNVTDFYNWISQYVVVTKD